MTRDNTREPGGSVRIIYKTFAVEVQALPGFLLCLLVTLLSRLGARLTRLAWGGGLEVWGGGLEGWPGLEWTQGTILYQLDR